MGDSIEQKYYKVWLSLIDNLGFKKYSNLIKRFQTNKGIFNASKKELLEVDLIDEKICYKLIDIEVKRSVKNHLKYMDLNGIDIISIYDKEYPIDLINIYNPPISLYIKGNKNSLNAKNISIVGCRDCTLYGKKVAQNISFILAKNNINVVSGLAKGIDAYSHWGAVYAKGKTIAVLGNGLDIIYPRANNKLAEKILENDGALITEFALGTKPIKNNFPARNRIISGICKCLVVVEAKKKSGTLITVDFALEQGREVFVVPGNIDCETSLGTNDLIKQGANIITSIDTFLEEIGSM